MLKQHPKGLWVAFLANMGERYGFYTMMAILVLFLQAKYGLMPKEAGKIYSTFYFGIYALALVGGIMADAMKKLMTTILLGLIIMFLGYALMAVPGFGLKVTLIALSIIAFGNGLFKGNLQALVGNLYEAPQYAALRDRAFNIFYMGINIGAFFAPSTATGIRNWWLKLHHLGYDGNLPQMAHAYLKGDKSLNIARFQELADKVSGHHVADLTAFAHQYIDVFSRGYHLAFGIAAASMVFSLLIYVIFSKYLKPGDFHKEKEKQTVGLSQKELDAIKEDTRERLIALGLVFLVVIFFWMVFHQNGLALTLFARDYVKEYVSRWSYMFFDVRTIILLVTAIVGLVYIFRKKSTTKTRIIWGLITIISLFLTYKIVMSYDPTMKIEAEKFLHFNPLFIIILTPIIVWYFEMLAKKGKEPSTPRKIAIGMFMASLAYIVLIIPSINLPAPHIIGTEGSPERISQYWLISTYLILTIAELFLSPMGISFVSKVAPDNLKGSMQGAWLGATALGNLSLQIASDLWEKLEIWQIWAIFVAVTALSGLFIVAIMKKLEKVAK